VFAAQIKYCSLIPAVLFDSWHVCASLRMKKLGSRNTDCGDILCWGFLLKFAEKIKIGRKLRTLYRDTYPAHVHDLSP
jgi:hypothetical protein